MSLNKGDNNTDQNQIVIQQTENGCTRIFHANVTEAAEIIITPDIEVVGGDSVCIGVPEILDDFPDVVDFCRFFVQQEVCVPIEVTFDANATEGRTGITECGELEPGDCEVPPPGVECCGLGAFLPATSVDVDFNFLGTLFEASAQGDLDICAAGQSGNCGPLAGSHVNLTLTGQGPLVVFNIQASEITELSCDLENNEITVTAVSDLMVGGLTFEDATFTVVISETGFTVSVEVNGTTILTTTVPALIDIIECNGN